MEKVNNIRKKLEKLNKTSRKRWFSRFPSHFPDEVWNGHWEREETLLLKELDSLKESDSKRFAQALKECNCRKYYMSYNNHTGRVGLNKEMTPEGGGVVAQAATEEDCLRKAFEIYGINEYFIL